ncbi:MAG: protein-disulfide reductase DsbD, partial [Pseudomonadota bacterium]|nr:protein-disulfide reductase DsbD [Pseudomonadota bacterium]
MRALLSVLLLGLITFSAPSMALFGNDQFGNNQNNAFGSSNDSFVPVDQAFPFNYYQQDGKLMLDWQVRDGYYLYQERLSVAGEKVSLGELQMEEGTPHKDEFFGDVHIYTQPLFVNVPMHDWQDGARVVVQYQGCAKAGFCYPPETRVIPISAFTSSNSDSTAATTAPKAEQAPTVTPPAAQSSTSSNTLSAPVTQQDSLAANLADNWWTPLLFLALGVGLAFTPCVLPMYPILTSIVLGSGKLSQRRALGLSFVYVQGMALTYTLLGLVVASAGMQFQAAMQHPYVLIGLSVLFVALALSMFGVYNLQ